LCSINLSRLVLRAATTGETRQSSQVVVVYVGGAGVYMLGGLEALGLVVDTDRPVTLSTRAQPSDG